MRTAVIIALSMLGGAAAQATSARCIGGFEWMYNTLGQSPCVVGSYLQGACVDTVFNISALPANQHYVGPLSPSVATQCTCSSITYVLVSGCGACQGTDITQQQKWSNWITNCSSSVVSTGSFPHRFANRTRIPAWAFEDVVQSDQFDINAARAIANESLPDVGPDGPISGGNGKKSGPNIGAIVGGVIGGLAVVGIVAAAAVYLCLRHRRSINRPAYSPAMTQQNGFLGPTEQPYATSYSLPGNGSVPSTTHLYDPHLGAGNGTAGSSPSVRPQSVVPQYTGPPQAYSPPPQAYSQPPPQAYSPPPQAYSPPPQVYPTPPPQHPFAAPPVQPFPDQRQAYTGIAEL